MRVTLRQLLFWPHLVAGIAAGLIIAVMSFTGVCIAFEHQILDWADARQRHVKVPAPDAPRLPLDEVLARVRTARPETPPTAVTVYPEPDLAVTVATGRGSAVYVDPYTGEVREQGARGWRAFLHTMEEWHRWLGMQGDNRPVGKAITGVSNTIFLLLGLTGLYLWWPRKWLWRSIRPTFWVRGGLKGKARDFNWHNVTGFWLLPVLLVLTASGMVISYKWASDFVFKLTGDTPPAAQGPMASAPIAVPTPPEGAQPLGLEALLGEARKQVPAWESITLRLGGPARGGGGPQGAPQQAANGGRGGERPQGTPGAEGARGGDRPQGASGPEVARGGERPEGARPQGAPGGPGGGEARQPRGPQAVTFAIREQGGWPLFASAQVSFDPFTAQVLRNEAFADYTAGRRLRTWLRFRHTGEALGWPGQLAAAVASLGGLLLVWTGFALSWRRFFPRRRPGSAPESTSLPEPASPLTPEAPKPTP